MKKNKPFFILILMGAVLVVAILIAYKKSTEITPPIFPSDKTDFTREEIYQAMYSDYKVPVNFYQINWERGKKKASDYLIYQTQPLSGGGSKPYCANNLSEAENEYDKWYKETSVKRTLESVLENEKFFEFKHLDIDSRGYKNIYRLRIHKCSYLNFSDKIRDNFYWDDDDHDGKWSNMNVGIFGVRPITQENIKEMAEYLWYIDNYNQGGRKVLSSITSETEEEIIQTLYETHFVGAGYRGGCDQIYVVKRELGVNKDMGEINIYYQLIKEMKEKCH